MNDPDGDYDPDTGTGTFKVSVPELIAASQVSGSGDDFKGPFSLNAVRIVNNGTRWNDTTVTPNVIRTRSKNYTFVIESVTVE